MAVLPTLALILLFAAVGSLGDSADATTEPITAVNLQMNITGITVSQFAIRKASAVCLAVARLAAESPSNCEVGSTKEACPAGQSPRACNELAVELEVNSATPAAVQKRLQAAVVDGTLAAALANIGVHLAPAATVAADSTATEAGLGGVAGTVGHGVSARIAAAVIVGGAVGAVACVALLTVARRRQLAACGTAGEDLEAAVQPNSPCRRAPRTVLIPIVDLSKGRSTWK